MEEPLKHFSDYHLKRTVEASEADRKLAEAIKKDLLEKLPKIVEHFSAFEEKSVHGLVERYAHMRMRFSKSPDFYLSHAEKIQLEYRPEADLCLHFIQHKKMFDLQCLWRADQVTLEGIECTFDFQRWEKDLYHCPFLPQITQQEVDMLITYLNEHPEEAALEPHYYAWQNYPYLKLTYYENEEIEPDEFYANYAVVTPMYDTGIPPWYTYYDTIMGTSNLLGLKDVKLPQEMEYRKIYGAYKKAQMKAELKKEGKEMPPPPKMPPKMKPWLGSEVDAIDAINIMVEKFESRDIQKLYKSYSIVENLDADHEDELINEQLETVIFELKDAREPVPVEANEDWRQALMIGLQKYKMRKIIEAVPAAYDDYMMRIQTGIGFPIPEDVELPQYIQEFKRDIMEGKRLAGEA